MLRVPGLQQAGGQRAQRDCPPGPAAYSGALAEADRDRTAPGLQRQTSPGSAIRAAVLAMIALAVVGRRRRHR